MAPIGSHALLDQPLSSAGPLKAQPSTMLIPLHQLLVIIISYESAPAGTTHFQSLATGLGKLTMGPHGEPRH